MAGSILALYALVRGLIFAALLTLLGCECARRLLRRTLSDRSELVAPIMTTVDTLSRRIAPALALLILVRGALQVMTFHDPGDPITRDLIGAVLLSGSWAHAWILQIAAAVVLTAITRTHRARGAVTPVLIAALIWGQSGMGHAAGDNWPGVSGRVLDSLHIVGAGLWLGTLAVLLVAALPRLPGDLFLVPLAALVREFSNYARVGVVLVVLSGTAEAIMYARPPGIALASTWGRLLILKLVAMALVLALGWYNWRVLTPELDAASGTAASRLRRAVRAELALGLVMLAITTLLVISPLPGEG